MGLTQENIEKYLWDFSSKKTIIQGIFWYVGWFVIVSIINIGIGGLFGPDFFGQYTIFFWIFINIIITFLLFKKYLSDTGRTKDILGNILFVIAVVSTCFLGMLGGLILLAILTVVLGKKETVLEKEV